MTNQEVMFINRVALNMRGVDLLKGNEFNFAAILEAAKKVIQDDKKIYTQVFKNDELKADVAKTLMQEVYASVKN